jgi:hypothetical protein
MMTFVGCEYYMPIIFISSNIRSCFVFKFIEILELLLDSKTCISTKLRLLFSIENKAKLLEFLLVMADDVKKLFKKL